ncbi:LolA-like outer membrane lipoprotein chaperone [Aliarcobacter vitoriensis]|uniref:Cell envelope biogenesis protein LolA n=1 Tax=Aliarcobacter vitoriensis TaxID=2011099 RepID=A0A366MT15_9BACT|nr:LolA-like outer membrane lipoprotein chaperone [Aliarcobacter vitoriensis]RBQ28734.1 cell envelope biogenesis protein LolA [Aliarcobacter vitoriensis]RBQ31410.1 cell envelope biogenesis protein LolA [Arcobacter sp. FW59]
MFYKYIFATVVLSIFAFAASDIKNLKTFQAQFTQTITSNSSDVILYKGQVFIKSSGKILWKYKTPVEKNVYIDNNSAIVDEPELEQAIFTKLENEINIIQLLKDAKKIDNNKYSSKIDSVQYLIFTKNNKIEKISYEDNLENSVEINFSNIIQDEDISDSIFIFSIPSNYDLIRK